MAMGFAELARGNAADDSYIPGRSSLCQNYAL